VAAGRINRSQILVTLSRLLDGWKKLATYHVSPLLRRTAHSIECPSNGTFVASNVRMQEFTPFGGDLDSPSLQPIMGSRIPRTSGDYLSFFTWEVTPQTTGFSVKIHPWFQVIGWIPQTLSYMGCI